MTAPTNDQLEAARTAARHKEADALGTLSRAVTYLERASLQASNMLEPEVVEAKARWVAARQAAEDATRARRSLTRTRY